MTELQLITWILLIPVIASVGILITGKYPNLREAVSIFAGIGLFSLVVQLAAITSLENPPSLVLAEPIPGLTLSLSLEPLGLLFALVASIL